MLSKLNACNIKMKQFFNFLSGPPMTLGLSLSAPSGTLQQAFSEMRQENTERSNSFEPAAVEKEAVTGPGTDAGQGPYSNSVLASSESVASTTGSSFPSVPLSAKITSAASSSGRVSPPSMIIQSQSPLCVTTDPSPVTHSSHETTPPQQPPGASTTPSSTVSVPAAQTSIPSLPGPQLSSNSVSPPSTIGSVSASEQQSFSSAVTSSQPMSSSMHAPQYQPVPLSTQLPPPSSMSSQSQVQPQLVESEGAEFQVKSAGRDDIQALDKKLRSLFQDQSSASSTTSVDPGHNTDTSSPPTGTSSPPPGAALVPPSHLPFSSGVQGSVGPTPTPGQGIAPAGHAQTPPSKPRAQVSLTFSVYGKIKTNVYCRINVYFVVSVCLDFTC